MNTAFAAITRRLKRILVQRGVTDHDADDYIQEAFRRLQEYRERNEVHHPDGFLVRTVSNLAVDDLRRRKRARIADQPVEDFTIVDESPRPDEVYAGRRRLERLNEGFEMLDPLTRQMLRAQRVEGLTVAAIAERNALSVSAVEKRLAKGLLFLVNWMDGW